jgi:hypothetical protein
MLEKAMCGSVNDNKKYFPPKLRAKASLRNVWGSSIHI